MHNPDACAGCAVHCFLSAMSCMDKLQKEPLEQVLGIEACLVPHGTCWHLHSMCRAHTSLTEAPHLQAEPSRRVHGRSVPLQGSPILWSLLAEVSQLQSRI